MMTRKRAVFGLSRINIIARRRKSCIVADSWQSS